MDYTMDKNYKYYAFISYSRQDEEWAMWLQHELENYHLPDTLKNREDLPKEFCPVFRDVDELKAGNLPDQIYEALKFSENLIVICSPRAVKSKWVNKEITDFIEIGNEKGINNNERIFPFIIEGAPDAQQEAQECFPKALRGQEILAGNVNENGRDKAFVKIMAGMLPNVGFDDIWNRYERDKAEEERRKREERDKLLTAQSRFVAEKANSILEEGDSYLARRLLVSVLPKDLGNPDRPYLAEAESSLRKACLENSAILRGFVGTPGSVSLSPNEKFIATVPWQGPMDRGDLRIWDIDNGSYWKPTPDESWMNVRGAFSLLTSSPKEVRFSLDGKNLILDMSQGFILTYDLESKTLINGVEKTDDESFVISPDGKFKWTYGKPKEIMCVASKKRGTVLLQTTEYFDGKKAEFSVDGRYIAVIDYRDAVVCNVETGVMILSVSEEKEIESVSFSPNGKYLVTTSARTIKIWDLADKQCIKTLVGHTDTVSYATFTNDGKRVVSTSMDKTMRLWDFEKDDDCQTLFDEMGWVYYATFSPDNQLIATASMDGKVRVWDADNRQCIRRFTGHSDQVNYVAFSPDGKHLASASKDKTIIIWSVEKETREHVLFEHRDNVAALSYSPDGNFLVSSSWDKTIKIWDIHTGKCINTYPYGGWTASYSPDGERIIVANGIYIIDAKTGEVVKRLAGHREVVNSAFYSFDGRKAVSASEDRTVRIWDVETEQCIQILRGHTGWVFFAAFSPDGKLVVSASEDKTVRVWDAETGICIRVFEGHGYDVKSAVFSNDGRKIVSAACDSTIKIWDFPSLQELIDQTRERFKDRPLTPKERRMYYLE